MSAVTCSDVTDVPSARVRLTGSDRLSAGRLEVYRSGIWASVHAYSVPNVPAVAATVCSQLGYTHSMTESFSTFHNPSTNAQLNTFSCANSAPSVLGCTSNGWNAYGPELAIACHNDIANPSAEWAGAVRLVGGVNNASNQGRVEVLHHGVFLPVCASQFFDEVAAGIVCRQLGFVGGPPTLEAPDAFARSDAVGRYGMVSYCEGFEATLSSCAGASPSFDGQCDSFAAMTCSSQTAEPAVTVMLTGTERASEGRLLVYRKGLWRPVAYSNNVPALAAVACKQLGFPTSAGSALTAYAPPQPNGLCWVNCVGTEDSVGGCDWSARNPEISAREGWMNEVEVACAPQGGDPRFSSAVRLVGGSSASQGRVEVLRYGTFEPLCGEAFGVRAATVVCRQLGYISDFAVVEPTDSFGSTPAGTSEALYIYNSDGGCSPGASSMYECGLGVTSPSCAMASLTCLGSKDEPAVPFRLTGSDRSSAGRLEVYRNDAWGAVHYNSVPDVPALVTVVCRQLGFDQGMSGQINVFKSPSSLQWDGLSCSGSEASVADCTTSGWTSNGDEISIACYKSDNANPSEQWSSSIRLVGGASDAQGRVEVLYRGEWAPVGANEFGLFAATVVCRQLGYLGGFATVEPPDSFGPVSADGSGSLVLSSWWSNCNVGSRSLQECGLRWARDYWPIQQASAVTCMPPRVAPSPPVRLTGGSATDGRLEVLYNGAWASVRTSNIPNVAAVADLACAHLGYPLSLTDQFSTYADPTVNVEWDSLSCSGSESSLLDCLFGSWTTGGPELAIACGDANNLPRFSSAVRLVDGTSGSNGRVEVLQHGIYTPLCADYVGPCTATTVCCQLGYTGDPASVQRPDTFGPLPSGAAQSLGLASWSQCGSSLHSLQEATLTSTGTTCSTAAITCSNSRPRYYQGFGVCQEQWGIVGGNLPNMPLAAVSLQECLAACHENEGCELMEYQYSGDCWLKSAAGGDGYTGYNPSLMLSCQKASCPAIADFKFYSAKDGGFSSSQVAGESVAGLAQLCAADPACKAFTTSGQLKSVLSRPSTWGLSAETGDCDGMYVKVGFVYDGFVDCKPQWDLVGGDLPGVPLADLTMEECLARCRDNADCEQIVYGVGASGLDCYLKSISGNDGNTGPDASVIASCVKDVPDCTSELNNEYCLTCGTTNSWRLTCLSTGTPCRATFTAGDGSMYSPIIGMCSVPELAPQGAAAGGTCPAYITTGGMRYNLRTSQTVAPADIIDYCISSDCLVGSVEGNVAGNVVLYSASDGSTALAAGQYQARYMDGCFEMAQTDGWGLGDGGSLGWYITDADRRGLSGLLASSPSYFEELSFQGCLANARQINMNPLVFDHPGGTAGLYLNDSYYSDNSPGSPSPVFQLERTQNCSIPACTQVTTNTYCVHCASNSDRLTCVAPGGTVCAAAWQGRSVTLQLCDTLSPGSGAADASCYNSVSDLSEIGGTDRTLAYLATRDRVPTDRDPVCP